MKKLVAEIDNINPYDISPEECKYWIVVADTLASTGVERVAGNEIQHTLKAMHPGTQVVEQVTVYIKQS